MSAVATFSGLAEAHNGKHYRASFDAAGLATPGISGNLTAHNLHVRHLSSPPLLRKVRALLNQPPASTVKRGKP